MTKQKRSVGFVNYGSSSNESDNGELAKDLYKSKKNIKKDDSDSLWEVITKTYLKFGIPRLFEIEKRRDNRLY